MAIIFLDKLDTMKAIACLFFLATTFCIAHSARVLDEIDPQQPHVINNLPQSTADDTDEAPVPVVSPSTEENPEGTQPEAEVPAIPAEKPAVVAAVAAPATGADADEDTDDIPPAATPSSEETPVVDAPLDAVAKEPSLSFFMHDILGGSHPSARVVAGIVASTDVTGLPLSKINNKLFPIPGGIPLVNPKLNGIVPNNNLPLLVGLNGPQSSTVFQNRGTNNAVTAGNNHPAGFTIQKLMFGSTTAIDDQLTKEQELDSNVIGRAQGFYLATSIDGTRQTIAVTVLLHGGCGDGHNEVVEDSISLFGIYRTASPESEIAVVGGTGKYENARGYAKLERVPKEDEHTTDGVDAELHFSAYLTE